MTNGSQASGRRGGPWPVRRGAQDVLFALAVVAFGLGPVAARVLDPSTILFFRDHHYAFRRLLFSVTEAYGEGRLPLWNPWAGGGEPLLGDWNALATSPLLLGFLGVSFEVGYDRFIFLHLLAAATSAYVLARRLGAPGGSAALAAVAYAASGIVVGTNSLLPAHQALAFGPLAIAAALEAWKRPSAPAVGLLGVALGLHAQFADPAFFLWDLAAFVAALVHVGPRPERGYARGGLALALGALLAPALFALHVVPLFERLSASPRSGGYPLSMLQQLSLSPWRIPELWAPQFGGSAVLGRVHFPVDSAPSLYLTSIYLGASILPLLAVGFVRSRASRPWLFVAILSIVVALGRFTPVHGWAVLVVPGLGASRFPVKHLYGLALAAPIAAAFAHAHLTSARESLDRPLLYGTLGAVGLGLGLALLSRSALPQPNDVTLEWTWASLSVGGFWAVASLVLVLLGASGPGGRVALAALPFVVAIDLGWSALPHYPVTDQDAFRVPALAEALHADVRFPGVVVSDDERVPRHLEAPRVDAYPRYRFERLTWDAADFTRTRWLVDQDLAAGRPPRWWQLYRLVSSLPEPEKVRLLGRLGQTHIGVEATSTRLPELVPIAEARPLGGDILTMFRIEGARGLAALETQWTTVDGPEEALSCARAGTSGACLERASAPEAVGADAGSGVRQPVEPRSFTPGAIELVATSTSPAVLVIAQQYREGWQATVAGVRRPTFPVDGIQLGVMVPAGTSDVVLRYRPPWLFPAAGLMATAWLLVIGLLIAGGLARTRILRPEAPIETSGSRRDSPRGG